MSDENEKEKNLKIPIKEIASVATGILTNKKIQRTILGEYSDGKVRSLPDAISDEILSPKQKKKYNSKSRKKHKKKKKFKYE